MKERDRKGTGGGGNRVAAFPVTAAAVFKNIRFIYNNSIYNRSYRV